MPRLPRRAHVTGVLKIERDEASSELRKRERPVPFIAGQREECTIGHGLHVIHRFGRRLWTTRTDFAIMIAEDRHEGSAAKQLRLRIDQCAEGFRTLAALLMQAADIVSRRHQHMHVVFDQCGEIRLRKTPVPHHSDAQLFGRHAFERVNGRGFSA